MSIISDIIKFRAAEQNRELLDLQAVSSAASRFLDAKQQAQQIRSDRDLVGARVKEIDSRENARRRSNDIDEPLAEARIRNIESQIEARKPSELERMLDEARMVSILSDAADVTGDRTDLDNVLNLMKSREMQESVDANLDPVVASVTRVPMPAPQVSQPSDAPQFGRTPSGRALSEEGKAQKDIFVASQKKKEEDKMALTKGSRAALGNVNLVSGAIHELAQTYADAYREGGAGDFMKAWKSAMGLKIGGDIGDKFDDTAAFGGQKTEVVSRMMPLLTQQGDKPGSVRLVQAVFERLEKTLPGEATGPKSAKNMMNKTIRNMYRFARAAHELGVTNEAVEGMSDKELDSLSKKVEQIARKINLSDTENDALNSLLKETLSPVDEVIDEKEWGKAKDFFSVEDAEKANLKPGTKIRINGRRAVIE